jgi:hypothetical protein
MSHYAKVLNGIVQQIIVAEQDFFNTFVDTSPGQWIQTSYNTRGGIHYDENGQPDNGVALRGNFAGVGYIYDFQNDVFYPPKPFPSWALNQTIWTWESPVPYPNDGKKYIWDESNQNWLINENLI